jgi:hypothetical protein
MVDHHWPVHQEPHDGHDVPVRTCNVDLMFELRLPSVALTCQLNVHSLFV